MRYLVNMFLSLALLINSGCAAMLIGGGAAAGVGTVAFIKGELRSTEQAALDQVWPAVISAMGELEFNVIQQTKDAVFAKLIARTSDDKKVKIDLIKKSDTITEIKIRVGTFGDQSLSRMILDKIKAKY